MLETFVINLDGSDGRLADATAVLGAAGISFQRLAAFDGRGKRAQDLPLYDEGRALGVFGRVLTGGEVGCFLSHIDGARRFLASGADYGLVLEDDLAVVPGAAGVLAGLVDRLAAGVARTPWHVVNLGQGARGWFTPLGDMGRGHQVVRAHYFPVTTTALLWNRDGAAAFVRDAGAVTMPVDHWLRVWATKAGTGLALNPPIFPAKGAESEIDAAGSRGAKRRGWRYFWAKQLRQATVKRVAAAAKAAFEGR